MISLDYNVIPFLQRAQKIAKKRMKIKDNCLNGSQCAAIGSRRALVEENKRIRKYERRQKLQDFILRTLEFFPFDGECSGEFFPFHNRTRLAQSSLSLDHPKSQTNYNQSLFISI
jgi:hypothetical protein